MALGHRLKQRVKNAAYLGAGALGMASRLARSGLGRAGLRAAVRAGAGREAELRVLTYHKVSPARDNPPSVPPSLFRAQMERLRSTANPVSLSDLLDARAGIRPLPPRAVLVTFDDGYRDNLEHAAPVLAGLAIPALIFLPTRFIDGDEPLPHDRALDGAGLKNPTLTWAEVRALAQRGFEIGSHGESHRVLSSLSTDEARGEIRRSKALLEERLERPVRAFAYVKGGRDSFTPETVRLVEEAGYQVAFTTITGAVATGDPPFTLCRYNVEPVSTFTFSRLLEGDCDLMAVKDSAAGIAGKRWLNRLLRSEVP